jgi:hypothetical protein
MVISKRWLLVGAFLLPVLALAACGDENGGDGEGASASAPNGASSDDEVRVELTEQNRSGESGTATLTARGANRTRVVLELRNPATNSQPAHIHRGRCGRGLDPQPLYGLQNAMQGRSETLVNAPLSELTGGRFAINVHHSDAEIATFVACGNLPGAVGETTSNDATGNDGGY